MVTNSSTRQGACLLSTAKSSTAGESLVVTTSVLHQQATKGNEGKGIERYEQAKAEQPGAHASHTRFVRQGRAPVQGVVSAPKSRSEST